MKIAPGKVVTFMTGSLVWSGLVLSARIKHLHEPIGLDAVPGARGSVTWECLLLSKRRREDEKTWRDTRVTKHELWTVL